MEISVLNVIIDKDMVCKPTQQVWEWEIPVLEAKHGDGKVREIGKATVERNALPNAADEFNRLRLVHGIDGGEHGTNISFVEMAYGSGRGKAGITALGKAIQSSVKKAAVKKKKTAAKKKTSAKKANEGDPLGLD